MSRPRWKYAVIERNIGFLVDYDTETRPRAGMLLAFRDKGVYRIVKREDPEGKNVGIGTIYVEKL